MWAPLAKVLVKDHTVIVPDLRGMACRPIRIRAIRRKNQAVDIAGVMDALNGEGSGSRDPRHRQYGGLRARGAVPGATSRAGS